MKVFLSLLLVVLMSSAALAGDFSVSTRSLGADGVVHATNIFDGCGGENLSPELEWRGAPAGTKSFAVTIYDPDAPTGSGWWHWTLFNLPPSVSQLAEGASLNSAKLPQGAVEGMNDFGKPGYGGPCPPAGDKPHRYVMTVYALKVARLDLGPTASGAMVGFHIRQNMLASASVTGIYGR